MNNLRLKTNTYTLNETADMLNIKVRTVREWLNLGKIIGRKSGRVWVITQEEIERIKAAQDRASGYRIEEAAAALGYKPVTVRGWCKSGLIASSKKPGERYIYIPVSEVERLKEEKRKKKSPA